MPQALQPPLWGLRRGILTEKIKKALTRALKINDRPERQEEKRMNSVMKGAGYVLVHTPDMVLHYGTTQTTERVYHDRDINSAINLKKLGLNYVLSERQEFKSVESKIPELALLALNLDVETENFARESKKHGDL